MYNYLNSVHTELLALSTKLPMPLKVVLVPGHSPRRKLFQVVGFVEDRQPPLRFRRPYPEPTLVQSHRRFGPPEMVLLGIPNLEGLVLPHKLVVDPKVRHLIDVPTTDLDGDAVASSVP